MQRRTAVQVGGILVAVLVMGALAMGPAMAMHSTLWGDTHYAPGSPQSGPRFSTVTIFASDTKPLTSFHVMVAPAYGRANGVTGGLDCGRASEGFFSGGPYLSDANGNIPNSTATLFNPPGTYRMCFYETVGQDRADDPTAVFTFPVSVTITS